MKEKEIEIIIHLDNPRIEKEGEYYIAYSDQLKLVGCGLTVSDAEKELYSIVKTSLKALMFEGTFPETLKAMGIKWEMKTSETDNQPISIPLRLVGATAS
ncbi:MAG TPA: hypothetical protein VMW60_01975 [Dehalococcoidales bacterium]|nr:hypothetical protein [Dehalococcoidales bacterium]